MNVPNLTHSAPLFKECQVMPIQDRVKFRTVTIVYKTLHGLTPTYMKEFFTYKSEIPGIAGIANKQIICTQANFMCNLMPHLYSLEFVPIIL